MHVVEVSRVDWSCVRGLSGHSKSHLVVIVAMARFYDIIA